MNALAQIKMKTNKQTTQQHTETVTRWRQVREREGERSKEKHIMFLSIQLYKMQNNREIAHKIVTSRNKTCIETCSEDSGRKKFNLSHIRKKINNDNIQMREKSLLVQMNMQCYFIIIA